MGKKGLSTHHRLIGGKLCLLLHHLYQISIELLQCVRASTGLSTNGFSPTPEPDPFALSVAKRSRRVDGNTRNGLFQKRIDITTDWTCLCFLSARRAGSASGEAPRDCFDGLVGREEGLDPELLE